MADQVPPLLELLSDLAGPLFETLIGKHVALEVDGARVEGTVTGFGTTAPDAAGRCWTLAVDGTHYVVDRETIDAVAAADG